MYECLTWLRKKTGEASVLMSLPYIQFHSAPLKTYIFSQLEELFVSIPLACFVGHIRSCVAFRWNPTHHKAIADARVLFDIRLTSKL